MAAITSSIGLISGINTGAIVDELMSIESQPVQVLQSQLDTTSAQQDAYTALATQLGSLQTIGQTLENPQTFQAATATSSNQNVLTATASNGAAVGSYNLQVAQLVTTQQMVSDGFADVDQTPVGAGTITIEMGGGNLATQTPLSALNGGAGVGSGEFRITDGSGNSAVIDTSGDVTLDDVLQQINTALNISVRASIQGNSIVLTDASGQTKSPLIVSDLGSGTAAADLGIAGSSTSGSIAGSDINYINSSTLLAQLNDGRGVQLGSGGDDFTVTLADGSTVGVNLATANTVGDVINDINTAGGGKLTASVGPDGSSLQLTDSSGGGGTMSITQDNGSQAATDLGLTTAPSGNVMTGKDVLGGIDSTLISSLMGGSGISLGSVSFTDGKNEHQTINFSNADSVQDIINDINNATGVKLHASLKSSGNGIQITDESGGTGNLVIADTGGGTMAQQLGIAGTFGAGTAAVQGADLQKQWVTNSTLLSTLNGGQGISSGTFDITNSLGHSTAITLNTTSTSTVADVLYQINSKDIPGVTAAINSSGNGIVVTDTAGGGGKLTITDQGGDTAADLNLAGTATGTSIDGAYEKTITVGPNDTLSSVESAINNLDFGVTATIINDGSATAPYRLSLTANNSGTAGQVTFDAGTTGLGTYNLVNAQNAAVFLGSSDGSANPLLITSSSNQITGAISGVTLTLNGVSSSPVQLSVANDPSGIVTQLTNFTSDFNSLVSNIGSLTAYNTTTNTGGILLGDSTTLDIQNDLYSMLNQSVANTGGSVHSLTDIGITVGNGGQLQFDQDAFQAAYATDPQAVQQLFTATQNVLQDDGTTKSENVGLGFAIDNQMDQLVDPVNGVITIENEGLSQKVQDFQDQIDSLNQVLSDKRNLLETQFANMESVLAGLQTQQASLSSLTGVSTDSSSKSSSS